MALLRHAGLAVRAALFCAVLLFAAETEGARAAEPCTSAVMYIAAHEDDTLLFQSPDLIRDIRGNHCVRTVFLTAGDAGRAAPYWEGRETGAEAAYALLADPEDDADAHWSVSTTAAAGHQILLKTLDGTGVSIAYMRLPDGKDDGEGFERYGFQSLEKLWKGGNLGSPSISSITAVDGSAAYTYQDLIDTLAALMGSFGARQVSTQNYLQAINGPDHPDHVVTGLFTQKAHQAYAAAHRLTAYQDYETAVPAPGLAENVSGELLAAKSDAFYEYGEHDSDACASEAQCAPTDYAKWLRRQYTAGSETKGVVANAGYSRTAAAGTQVTLDGSDSSREGGGALGFSWTQIGGPQVALTGASTDEPSLVTPPHPTLLTFSLVVKGGSTSSAPATVRVRVPSADPTPVAIAGSGQTVASGASVSLDGSESWDPNSLPLQYSWAQTAGPAVALSGAGTAAPSFTAPTGPATLKFALTVSNGSQTSTASSTVIEVAEGRRPTPEPTPPAPPPPSPGQPLTFKQELRLRLSRSTVRLTVGRPGRHAIKVLPKPASVRCVGSLPKGARCRVTARRDVVVEGSARVMRAGTYRLWVRASGPEGEAQRPLVVRVRRPGRR